VENIFEPKNKRERSRAYFRASADGKLPWTARGIEECMRHLQKTRSELTEEETKDWNPYLESLFFTETKYGESKGTVHCLRMGQIINFIQHYRPRMKRDKLIIRDKQGTEFWEDNLAEAFAKLPFTIKSFRYDDVRSYVQRCKKPS
jgi:hypothetical protein